MLQLLNQFLGSATQYLLIKQLIVDKVEEWLAEIQAKQKEELESLGVSDEVLTKIAQNANT